MNIETLRENLIHQIVAHEKDGQNLKLINQAIDLATSAHQLQRRDDGTPYILHPLRVALILLSELQLYDKDMICAALLHDVMEDGDNSILKNMQNTFNKNVLSQVKALSKPQRKGQDYDEVNAIYFPRIQQAVQNIRLIKLADRLDNLRDLVNCSDDTKRQRIIHETQSFYLSLIETLNTPALKEKLRNAYKEALHTAINL